MWWLGFGARAHGEGHLGVDLRVHTCAMPRTGGDLAGARVAVCAATQSRHPSARPPAPAADGISRAGRGLWNGGPTPACAAACRVVYGSMRAVGVLGALLISVAVCGLALRVSEVQHSCAPWGLSDIGDALGA